MKKFVRSSAKLPLSAPWLLQTFTTGAAVLIGEHQSSPLLCRVFGELIIIATSIDCSVLTVYLNSTNRVTGTTYSGKLHLVRVCAVSFFFLSLSLSCFLASGSLIFFFHQVDLAGSENVARSDVLGQQLREAQFINKSLSALADVFLALSQKNKHVPYRNSKLTHFLSDSLGGDSKTLMMVCVNPGDDCLAESLNSLNFAVRARTGIISWFFTLFTLFSNDRE